MSFLMFHTKGLSPSGKTKIWNVYSIYASLIDRPLGQIQWHGPWRKYVFFPANETLFDHGCLTEIADFVRLKTEEHKHGSNANLVG